MRPLFLYVFLLLTWLMAITQDLEKEALGYYSEGNFEKACSFFDRLFYQNDWKGTVENHWYYAESLAQCNLSDSALLHLSKLIKAGVVADTLQLSGNVNLAILKKTEQWKQLIQEVKERQIAISIKLDLSLCILLEDVYHQDQKLRLQLESVVTNFGFHSLEYESLKSSINIADLENQAIVDSILTNRDWPEPNTLTQLANNALFLVIQHGDSAYHSKYANLVYQAFLESKISAQDWALFSDRQHMYKKEPQVYGTQVIYIDSLNSWQLYPVDNPTELDQRRQSIGLKPINEYFELLGLDPKTVIRSQ